MIHLDLDVLLLIARRTLGAEPKVRDYGLLQSALARPQATVFGADAYATLADKAAALLHSLLRNHALVDGNKRLGWAATAVFCDINGHFIDMPDDEAYDLVIAVASADLDVPEIADRLTPFLSADHPHLAEGAVPRPRSGRLPERAL